MPRSLRWISLALVVCLVGTVSGCKKDGDGASGGGAASADLSTPKSAAKAVMQAMMNGDSATVRALSIGTEEQLKTVDTMCRMIGAQKKLNDAAVAKFGADNELSKHSGKAESDKEIADLEKAEFKIDGDVATRTDKGPDSKQMQLKKVDGKWKVDLSKEAMGASPAEAMGGIDAMSKAYEEMAAEISAGKYADAKAAKEAVGKKMMSAMMSAPKGK